MSIFQLSIYRSACLPACCSIFSPFPFFACEQALETLTLESPRAACALQNFLQKALMPLHKPKCVGMYHQQLAYCITQVLIRTETDRQTGEGCHALWPVGQMCVLRTAPFCVCLSICSFLLIVWAECVRGGPFVSSG
jgi:Protein phosphatase 2A regulatory B subunit (B56 family)